MCAIFGVFYLVFGGFVVFEVEGEGERGGQEKCISCLSAGEVLFFAVGCFLDFSQRIGQRRIRVLHKCWFPCGGLYSLFSSLLHLLGLVLFEDVSVEVSVDVCVCMKQSDGGDLVWKQEGIRAFLLQRAFILLFEFPLWRLSGCWWVDISYVT